MKTVLNTAESKSPSRPVFRKRSAPKLTWVTVIPPPLILRTLPTAKTTESCWCQKPEKCYITFATGPIGRAKCEVNGKHGSVLGHPGIRGGSPPTDGSPGLRVRRGRRWGGVFHPRQRGKLSKDFSATAHAAAGR